MSEKYSAEEVPEGFIDTQFIINGKTLKGVTNNSLNLVYLKPIDNVTGPGKFYVFDQATGTVSNYFFLGRADYYVIPSEPSELINDSLRKGQISIDGKPVEVYTLQGIEDFVYVYGKSSDGVMGWFEYDVSGNTVQRINEAIFNNVQSAGAADKLSSYVEKLRAINIRYIIAAVVFIIIVVVAIIVNVILKKRDDKADLIDGDEDYMADKNVPKKDSPNSDITNKGVDEEPFSDAKSDKKAAKERAKAEKEAAKEAARREKEEAKARKAEEKALKKEERQKKKGKNIDAYMEEIIDEYDDFDIDRGGKATSGKADDVNVINKSDKSYDLNEDNEDKLYKVSDITNSKKDSPIKEEPTKTEPIKDYSDKDYEIKPSGESVGDIFDDDNSKNKNIFGDDELDLKKESPKGKNKRRPAHTGETGIIDLNDL